MTIAEIIALCAAVFSGGSVAFGAVYMRGKFDAQATETARRLDELGVKIDAIETGREDDAEARGAQVVRNENVERIAKEAREAEKLATRVEARLDAHEAGCKDRQAANVGRFDKLDRDIERLGRLINNIVSGEANRLREVPANRSGSA